LRLIETVAASQSNLLLHVAATAHGVLCWLCDASYRCLLLTAKQCETVAASYSKLLAATGITASGVQRLLSKLHLH
jgi:hypothetical protein